MTTFEIISGILAINVIIAFAFSVYFNLYYIICSGKKWIPREDVWLSYIKVFIGLYFIGIFSYNLFLTITSTSPLDTLQFGVIYIRPILLIIGTSTAISTYQKIHRYKCGGDKWKMLP